MILLFTNICKYFHNKTEFISDERSFQDASAGFKHHGKRCPNCGANGCLEPYTGYQRHLVYRQNGKSIDSRLDILRFKCDSCGVTHALLPDVLIPYCPYGLRFRFSVLIAYFERKTTVVNICESFGIAVSTLYRWKKQFLEHKDLLLGILVNKAISALVFIREFLADSPESLQQFFIKYGFSFLQSGHKTARSVPP
jgi:hypothetical protein